MSGVTGLVVGLDDVIAGRSGCIVVAAERPHAKVRAHRVPPQGPRTRQGLDLVGLRPGLSHAAPPTPGSRTTFPSPRHDPHPRHDVEPRPGSLRTKVSSLWTSALFDDGRKMLFLWEN